MRSVMLLAAVVLSLVVTPVIVCGQTAEDEAAIRELGRRFEAAYNQDDVDGMVAVLHEKFLMRNGTGGVTTGLDTFHKQWTETHAGVLSAERGATLRDNVGDVYFLSPTVAIMYGRAELTSVGATAPAHLLYFQTIIKENGIWRIGAEQMVRQSPPAAQ